MTVSWMLPARATCGTAYNRPPGSPGEALKHGAPACGIHCNYPPGLHLKRNGTSRNACCASLRYGCAAQSRCGTGCSNPADGRQGTDPGSPMLEGHVPGCARSSYGPAGSASYGRLCSRSVRGTSCTPRRGGWRSCREPQPPCRGIRAISPRENPASETVSWRRRRLSGPQRSLFPPKLRSTAPEALS